MTKLTPAIFAPVCNRSSDDAAASFSLPADGMIQIVPKGYAVGSNAKGEPVRQLVDERALSLILAGLRPGDMLMDREHESHDPEKRTDALAWADLSTAVQREDGLWAKPRLTNTGNVEVLGGTLRFVSPEFPEATLEVIEPGLFRPTQLSGLSFTNRPGFRNAKPVTNRQPNPPENQAMKVDICKLLKLDANVEDAVVLNRINEIIVAANKVPDLEKEMGEIRNREADAWMETNKGIMPADEAKRKIVRDLYITNRDGAEAMVAAFQAVAPGQTDEEKKAEAARIARGETKPVFNREAASAPAAEAEQKKQVARAAAIKNRATALMGEAKTAGRTMTFDAAFAAAEAEIK